jgi:hypothetical protein
MAVTQICELLSQIVDRISSIPSPWIEALTPLLTWFTLHKSDSLVSSILNHSESLKNDLSRVHKQLANFINQEFKVKGTKSLSAAEEEE